jgi:hypothetical protein
MGAVEFRVFGKPLPVRRLRCRTPLLTGWLETPGPAGITPHGKFSLFLGVLGQVPETSGLVHPGITKPFRKVVPINSPYKSEILFLHGESFEINGVPPF